MPYIFMAPEKDIHITNSDGSDYVIYEKGTLFRRLDSE